MPRSSLLPSLIGVLLAVLGCRTPGTLLTMEPGTSDPRWSSIDSLEEKGLYADALRLTDEVLATARSEGDRLTEFRAWMERARFQGYTGVDESVSLDELEARAGDAPEPLRALLHSALGQAWWQRYENERWRVLDRTNTIGDPDDPDTWGQRAYMAKVLGHFQASLEARDTLVELPVHVLDGLLDPAGEAHLRPTVYDLLAHRALAVFTNPETRLAEPASHFQLDQEKDFALFESFAHPRQQHPDSASWLFQALRLYRDLARLHLSDTRPDALVDVELQRLAFVREHSVLPDKDSLYLDALTTLRTRLPKDSCWSEVTHAMARFHAGRGEHYQRLAGDVYKHARDTAVALCEEGIARFPGSFGARHCEALKRELIRPVLRLQAEEAVALEQAFRALLFHTNLQEVFWRIVPEPDDARQEHLDADWVKVLLSRKPVVQGKQELPDHDDLNEHAVELPFEGLPVGGYRLVISATEDLDPAKGPLVHVPFRTTHLSLVERQGPENATELLVLDRVTGRPLEGAEVLLMLHRREGRSTSLVEQDRRRTDAEGRVVFPFPGERGNGHWEVRSAEDRIRVATRYFWQRNELQEQERIRTFLFTDRAIYRPGQPVFFKGLVVRGRGADHQVVKDLTTSIALHDTHGEVVAELAVTTDAFGTFHGSFTAPTGTLTGVMRLAEEHGSQAIRVEEYKRPTFEVVLDPVSGSPVLGEAVEVSGAATSYAGVLLDGAAVQWRVLREPRMPWWCGTYWRSEIPWGTSTEIAQGTSTCDASGHFSLSFPALADPDIPMAADPLFHYRVEASVTDLNGETQSGSTGLVVGQRRFTIDVGLSEGLSRPEADSLQVKVRNLNGEALDLPASVTIERVVPPGGKLLRERTWERPDGFVLERGEHTRLFPDDPYDNETDPMTWPAETAVLERNEVRGPFALTDVRSWRVGTYRITVSAQDGSGAELKVGRTFALYDPDIQWTGFDAEAMHVEPVKAQVEPGGKAVLLLSTGLDEASVLMEVERGGAIALRRRFALRQGQQRIELPVQENDRGGLTVHFLCVERGRAHRRSVPITVPWSNKQLEVEWMSFRDKLRPGDQEEWRLTIKGPGGKAVAAQLLAGMYDASLDAFVPHAWQVPDLWPVHRPRFAWDQVRPFGVATGRPVWWQPFRVDVPQHTYPTLNTYGFPGGGMLYAMDAMMMRGAAEGFADDDMNAEEEVKDKAEAPGSEAGPTPQPPPLVRTDFRETAFFLPDQLTDRDGNIVLRFTVPDALTRWKVLGLAHTTALQLAGFEREAITQRPLMVVPNLPRYFREGDRITVTAKINALEQRVEGPARLELFDPFTNAALDKAFGLQVPEQVFVAAPGASASVAWELQVPEGVQAVGVRITARGGGGPVGGASYGDGEEHVLPVLTDRALVTESLPLPVSSPGTHAFTLQKLLDSGKSNTLRHERLQLEFTPNPAWTAVQALPYLMEFPHACAEQVFSRYYANRLAGHVVGEKPRIREVFEQWREAGPDAFLSALEKDRELKDIALAETPWLLDARDERERKERIALLFDLDRMAGEEAKALQQLGDMQGSDGAWSWFGGMRPSPYITRHIVAGFGHLEALGAADLRPDGEVQGMLQRAVGWLDDHLRERHRELKDRLSAKELSAYRPGPDELHHLYARSFFRRWPTAGANAAAYRFYQDRAAAEWLSYGLQEQLLLALALHRSGDVSTARDILNSLRQRATIDDELGMTWKSFRAGMDWWAFPAETHALAIEAFHEVAGDDEAVKQLRIHLLKLKRTTDWKTTKATAEAVHALLLGGPDLLGEGPAPVITLGSERVDPSAQEPGTGAFNATWGPEEVRPDMGRVTVTTTDDRVAWGALHWRYFERMDAVTPHESPFDLRRQVMLRENTDEGPVLVSLDQARTLRPGDVLTVRIELRTDRWLDFVHLKDLRAAGTEPLERLSGYRYQDGLGYYQSVRDAALHIFIDRMAPGAYVFEHELRVTHDGDFSQGVTSAQCMYAPEFNSHSEGVRVAVGH